MSPQTIRFLQRCLDMVQLDMSAEDFEQVAAEAAQAKAELRDALGEAEPAG